MLTLVFSLLLFPADETDIFKELLEMAGPEHSKEVRIEALKQLKEQYRTKPNDPGSICKTLEKYVADKDIEIRREAILALGSVALSSRLECPLPIVESLDDTDEIISASVKSYVIAFNSFPKRAIPLLIEASKSNDRSMRMATVQALRTAGANSPDALSALKKMLNDPDDDVKDLAYNGYFVVTDDMSTYITYLLASSSDLNEYPQAKTAAEKEKEKSRKGRLYGAAIQFYAFLRNRPRDLAKELVANLEHKDPRVRQAALKQLRAMCISSTESYQAIPKAEAQKKVAKLLLRDGIEKVRTSALLAHLALEEGPPPDAPQKVKPLRSLDGGDEKPAKEK